MLFEPAARGGCGTGEGSDIKKNVKNLSLSLDSLVCAVRPLCRLTFVCLTFVLLQKTDKIYIFFRSKETISLQHLRLKK